MAGTARRPLRLRLILVGAVVAALAGAYAMLRDTATFQSLEGQTLSWRFQLRGPLAPPEGVAVLAIDDRTIAAIGQWPLPRALLADAIGRLAEAGAAAIGIDLLLLAAEAGTDGSGDAALAAALQAAGPRTVLSAPVLFGPEAIAGVGVVAAAAFPVVRMAGPLDAALLLRGSGMLPPLPAFRDGPAFGHVNVPVDRDGMARVLPLAAAIGRDVVPALPLQAARLAAGLEPAAAVVELGDGIRLGARLIPTDPGMRLPFNYYGPPGTVETLSMIELLAGRVPAAAIEGRIVLVGASALGLGDHFVTPFSADMPGVELLATAAANIAEGPVLRHDWRLALWDLAAILALGALACLLAHIPSLPLAALATAALLAAWSALATMLFIHAQLWLNMLVPTASLILAATITLMHRGAVERRARQTAERQRGNLARYQSPLLAELLAEDATAWAEGQAIEAAILFLDLAGFTGRSERLGPARTAAFLRDFHQRVERAVLAHRGLLTGFTGDGAMVIFGVPKPSATDGATALRCAHALLGDIAAWGRDTGEALRIGVGIHQGPVVLARLGGEHQAQLTAAGDTVNVASRLQALTRAHDAAIAISAALADAVRAAGEAALLAGFVELPPQPIRGRAEPLAVWILPTEPPT